MHGLLDLCELDDILQVIDGRMRGLEGAADISDAYAEARGGLMPDRMSAMCLAMRTGNERDGEDRWQRDAR